MKKLLVFSLLLLLSIGIKAEDLPRIPNFSFNEENAETINEWVSFLNSHKTQFEEAKQYNQWLFRFKIIQAFIGKTASNITYSEYKKIIFDIYEKDFKEILHENNTKLAIVQFTNCTKASKFGKFMLDAFNDKSVNTSSTIEYKNKYIFPKIYKNLDIEEFRTIIFDNIKESVKKNNPEMVCKNLKFYQDRLIEMNSAEALKELKKFKVLIYPKIENEDWKKAVVINELMIKALE